MAKKTMPEKLYVRLDEYGEDYIAEKKVEHLWNEDSEDDDGGINVGVYKLEKTVRVRRKVEVIDA